ncbi:MAG TPA: hypothetical protein VMU61_15835 [Candidatus Aquilonibacter sp.]|nr:hypothetical protein [Candidatus Aquilonibacter sp.]
MDVIRTSPAVTPRLPRTILPELETRRMERPPQSAPAEPRKASGYGLPCAKCHLYYPADLDVCPTCKSRERVPAVTAPVLPRIQASAEPMPDVAALEQEREEFLRQFKFHMDAAQAELANAASSCTLAEHPSDEDESAAVCKSCYDRLQQRVDVCEAALHIDLKEAAQIVYDAVWADPSDPNKTYSNAANALLTELRKRAGVPSLLRPFQPLAH